jgi:SNF2 family DNA or RNA helicase
MIDDPTLISAAGIFSTLSIPIKNITDNFAPIPVNKLPFVIAYIREKNLDIFIEQRLIDTINILTSPQIEKKFSPTSINGNMRDYQLTGFAWLKTLANFGIGGILADDMGLGKTLQVLAFLNSELETNKLPSLVVAPTSLIYNWYDEVQKFVPNMRVLVVTGTKNERLIKVDDFNNYDLIVTSFGLLKNDIELYQEKDFAYCIVDEAQNIKNSQTLNSDSVKKIKAKCSFALTGTPVENNLSELWSIFDFVLPNHLPSYNKFVQQFEKPIVKENDKQTAHKLAEYIKPFVLRRLKKDVLKELPDKIESVISTRMTKEQETLYKAFLSKGVSEIRNNIKNHGFDKNRFEILALLTRLRQICAHPSLFLGDYPGGSG